MPQDRILRTSQLGPLVGKRAATIHKWRERYPDFPKYDHGNEDYPLYSEKKFLNWYINKWPERADNITRYVHRFVVRLGAGEYQMVKSGSQRDMVAYVHAVRDVAYPDWKIKSSSIGFVASKDGSTIIMVVDAETPEDWFIYEQRILNR